MNWFLSLFQDRTFGVARSSEWSNFRNLNTGEKCEACGTRYFLELHHIWPFHLFPDRELDTENVMTLCRKHHLEMGHLFSWRSYNTDIRGWILKIKDRP